MERSEITARLRELLLSANMSDPKLIESCTEDSRLIEDLGFSSAAMLYMVIAIEESFHMRFGNVGMADFKTLRDVVTYIEKALE
ncbi:MAG: acyl carrier protein [Christensenellales bacterium]|jgi:acyl carrier protein|nr:acyl carrier protein [Eubacteriales bacterium]MCI6028296.1 acyl carrier protein [Clostridiales bacterium]